jgi:hypothetical protein
LIVNYGLFWQTGSITRRKSSRRPTKRTLEFVDAVKEIMEKESKTSLRHLSSSEASVETYRTIFKKGFISLPNDFCSGTVS